MLVLHPQSLSPDPLYGRVLQKAADGWGRVHLHPVEVVRGHGCEPWPAASLERWKQPVPLEIPGDGLSRAELLLDFGTEFEGILQLGLRAPGPMNVYVTFGESEPEAAGLGGYGQGSWGQVVHWHVPGVGLHTHAFPAVGFRFVRLQIHDLERPAVLEYVGAEGWFAGERQVGDFACSDKTLQRLWQTSAYTARACTRPDDLWDGIKRDRLGWYGDARITAMTWAATFFDPLPAAKMLGKLSTQQWANGIPNFSFDGVAMLADQIAVFGVDVPERKENWALVEDFLEWVNRTQVNKDGFIIRHTQEEGAGGSSGAVELFFDYGFLDWSAMPAGGRLEELSWLQCKYLEALRHAARISRWLGVPASEATYRSRADALEAGIIQKFWQSDLGFHHTLRTVRPGHEKYGPGWAEPSYDSAIRGVPSGPTRHSTACAVFAGLASGERRPILLQKGFEATGQPPVATPMFMYYEQEARARLGDPAGALTRMRNWLAEMVVVNDAATIWESFEPEVKDFRRWGLHAWPKSLCHGWGSGLVPLMQRWGLGIENLGPGWSSVRLHKPVVDLDVFATIPTPHGTITIADGEIDLPAGIRVSDKR